MKRFSTAAVATIAAITLSTTSAHAFDDFRELSTANVDETDNVLSSKNPDEARGDNTAGHKTSHQMYQSSYGQSSADGQESSDDTWGGIFGSSYDFDEDREWDTGPSADVLIAGLIAFGIAAFNGFIPGIEVPSIPGL